MTQNELYHYGIKRRSGRYPWGSGDRPFQNSPSRKEANQALKGKGRPEIYRQRRTIPKGTKVYRSTHDPNEKLTTAYVSYLDPDRDLYKGGEIARRDRSKKVYEREMVLKEDLKIPSRQRVKDIVKQITDEDPKLIDDTIKAILDYRIPKDSVTYYEITTDWKTGKTDLKLYDKYVKDVINAVKDQSVDDAFANLVGGLGHSNKLKNQLINQLKKEGYNAMVDEAGVGAHTPEGVDPLIVFDFNKTISPVSTKEVTKKEETKSWNNYNKWVRTARANKYMNKSDW